MTEQVPESVREIDEHLCHVSQFMDACKHQAPSEWTEWDQQVRDRCTVLRGRLVTDVIGLATVTAQRDEAVSTMTSYYDRIRNLEQRELELAALLGRAVYYVRFHKTAAACELDDEIKAAIAFRA